MCGFITARDWGGAARRTAAASTHRRMVRKILPLSRSRAIFSSVIIPRRGPIRSNYRSALPGHPQDDLSDIDVRLHPLVGPRRLPPVEDRIDDGDQPAVGEPGEREIGEPTGETDLPRGVHAAQPGPRDPQ